MTSPPPPAWTVGALARRHGLSRSTLLYYDRLGLLRPGGRSSAGYRRYGAEDDRRLARICELRAAGLPLAQVARVLDGPQDATAAVLGRHLAALNAEIAALRRQQRAVLALLGDGARTAGTRTLDKERWVEILRATGLTEADLARWHAEFERLSPDAHQDFLEGIGIAPEDITRIREWSRTLG